MAPFLLMQPEQPDDADTPLRHVMMGPLVPQVEEFKRRFGVEVGTGYGMTEIGAPFASDGYRLANSDELRQGPHRLGGLRGAHRRRARRAARSRRGRRAGRAHQRSRGSINRGYYGMPEVTAAAWRNGWFHTGDAFTYDADGNYYFVDRIKDAIRRRGENISSFEVEALVGRHPDVVGVRGDRGAVGVSRGRGEGLRRAGARVPSSPTRSSSSSSNRRMPTFMVPRYVEFVAALPKTEATLRTRKIELRDDVLNERTWDRETGTFWHPVPDPVDAKEAAKEARSAQA